MSCTCNPLFIWRDSGTFHRHVVLQRSQGRVDGDLVIGLVTVRKAQVIVLQLHVHVGQDELTTTTTRSKTDLFQ